MKTPIQLLIEQLKNNLSQEYTVIENPTEYEKTDVKQAKLIANITQNTIQMAEQLLEVEKQIIISAYEYNSGGTGFLYGKDYYEQTFN